MVQSNVTYQELVKNKDLMGMLIYLLADQEGVGVIFHDYEKKQKKVGA